MWLTTEPLPSNGGHGRDAVVALDLPDELISDYALPKLPAGHQDFCVPAELCNRYPLVEYRPLSWYKASTGEKFARLPKIPVEGRAKYVVGVLAIASAVILGIVASPVLGIVLAGLSVLFLPWDPLWALYDLSDTNDGGDGDFGDWDFGD